MPHVILQLRLQLTTASRMLAFIIFFCFATIGRAGTGDPAGVSSLIFVPLAVIYAPFYVIDKIANIPSEQLKRNTAKRAEQILANSENIETSGVYFETAFPLRGLFNLLTEGRLPIVEMPVTSAIEAFRWNKRISERLTTFAKEQPYIRFSLATDGNANCLASYRDARPSYFGLVWMRPNTCLAAVPAPVIASELKFQLNADYKTNGELRWEIVRRRDGTVLLAVPYWVEQKEGEPLRTAEGGDAYCETLKKITAHPPTVAGDGRPFVLNSDRTPSLGYVSKVTKIQAKLSKVEDQSGKLTEELKWSIESAFSEAMTTGHPTIVNNALAIIPKNYSIIRLPDFSQNFATDCCVFSTPLIDFVGARVTAVKYSPTLDKQGVLFWQILLTPDTYPEFDGCSFDPNTRASQCKFFSHRIVVSETDLEVYVSVISSAQLPSNLFKLSVPLADLPVIP